MDISKQPKLTLGIFRTATAELPDTIEILADGEYCDAVWKADGCISVANNWFDADGDPIEDECEYLWQVPGGQTWTFQGLSDLRDTLDELANLVSSGCASKSEEEGVIKTARRQLRYVERKIAEALTSGECDCANGECDFG